MAPSPPAAPRGPQILLAAVVVAWTVLMAASGPARAATPWQWPVDPAHVINAFDPPAHPWESGHRGVDLAAAIGQTVHAPTGGSVTFAGVIAGRGVVVVSHGSVRTTYEPVDGAVPVGTAVDAGDAIGTLQPFAHHCSTPCLHWGAIEGRTYLDPTSFVVPKPSRLLPLWSDGVRLAGPGSASDARGPASDGRQPAPPAADPAAGAAAPPPPATGAEPSRDVGPTAPIVDLDAVATAPDVRAAPPTVQLSAPPSVVRPDGTSRRPATVASTAGTGSSPMAVGVIAAAALVLGAGVARTARRERHSPPERGS